MSVIYHYDIEQGTQEWHDIRRGKITASTIKAMLTAGGKIADNETSRRAVFEIAMERLTGFSEETPTTFSMARGHDDEVVARELYHDNVAPVTECGFVTNDDYGVMIGCSPDGLVHAAGGIEVKSRLHALQLRTILDNEVPAEYMAQIQTCLLVTGREWWDFCSIPAFGGGKMLVKTVFPDRVFQETLVEAARECEKRVAEVMERYQDIVDSDHLTLLDVPRRQNDEADVEIKL